MSSSEIDREHGPLVVLLLPAVLGGLTLLLARRWANANSATTLHGTAVSRRRRILKDPLARRAVPQPVNQQRMLTSRRTTSSPALPTIGRKSSCEEEWPLGAAMPPGGRKLARAPRYSPAPAPLPPAPEPATTEPPPVPAPKHLPFPPVQLDSELLFESMTFLFTSVAAGLQFLNLYRTVWWLPHSHTSQAMNFYLIDAHVVGFIVTLLSRRLLLSVTMTLLSYVFTSKMMTHAALAARMFILGVVLGALAWCTYFIILKHPLLNVFYLCYPAVIYFIFFGLQAAPFLELANSDRPLLHSCYPTSNGVRNEVDLMKSDFNLRVKKMLFCSFIGAYYTSFIPCCFAQTYLYYDIYAATQQVGLVWGGLFTRYASHLLNAQYCDTLHRSAHHLGGWRLQPRDPTNPPPPWCARTLWPCGARVATQDGTVYVAHGLVNAAEPTNSSHQRFYGVFQNPSMLLCLLLCLQLSLILVQLCLLFSSSHWHHFLSLSILLFINYYTLFKLVRDYLVTWKVYRAELELHKKRAAAAS